MNTPNDRSEKEDFDPLLEGLFSREHTHLPAEPFASKTLEAIAAERRRAVLAKRLRLAAASLALIVLSPLLIDGSAWLSTRLDEFFALTSSWLATPYGMAAGVVVALVVIVARRARVW